MKTSRAAEVGGRVFVAVLVLAGPTLPTGRAYGNDGATSAPPSPPSGQRTSSSAPVPVTVDSAPAPAAGLFPSPSTPDAPVGLFDEADVPLAEEEGPGPQLPVVPSGGETDVAQQPLDGVLGVDPASMPAPVEVPVPAANAPSDPYSLPPDVLPPDVGVPPVATPTSDTTTSAPDTTTSTVDTTPPASDTTTSSVDTTPPQPVAGTPAPATAIAFQPAAFRAGVAPLPHRRLRYVVIPHPDDEFEAWSLVEHAPDHYAVFLLMTRGEASGYCSGSGILNTDTGDQTVFGERLPQPQPFTGKQTKNCKAQRVDAFDASFDALAAVDGSLGSPGYVGRFVVPARHGQFSPTRTEDGQTVAANYFDVWVGALSARVVFDLGDAQLTAQKVTWAIQSVRRMRGRLPVHTEDDIVGSAYYNPGFTGSVPYGHPDHYAVQLALFETDQGTPGPQWGRTVPGDPNLRRRAFVDTATYCAVMCTDPLPIDPYGSPVAIRTGAYQRVYGWLAFCSLPGRPAPNTFWPASFEPSESVFSQAQDFWRRFGTEGRTPAPEDRAVGFLGRSQGLDELVMVVVALSVLLAAAHRRHEWRGGRNSTADPSTF